MLSFFQWCEATRLASGIRASYWLFPAIEAVHLLAFAALGGMILILNLRLLGVAMREEPAASIARQVRPWLTTALGVMLITGVLLFVSEAVKCYYSDPFWIKMECLAAAIVFTFTVHWKIVTADEARIGPVWTRVAAVASIVLWAGVAWGGRWIGFSG
jgi:Family of unknown function (DUF6644)